MPSRRPRRILVSHAAPSSLLSSAARAGAEPASTDAASTKAAAAAANLAENIGRIEGVRTGLEGIEIAKDFSRVNETIAADQGAFAARSPKRRSYCRPM